MGVHALYTAASGMDAQLRNIDVIANNIANIATDGFRKDRVNFADLFYRQQALAGSTGLGPNPRPSGINVGHGVRVVSTEKMFETVPPKITDKPTDMAILSNRGNLFFQVETANGTAYTRAGNFTRNSAGRLATPAGHLLADVGAIPPEGSVNIDQNGRVLSQDQVGQPEQEIGRVLLARFVNPAGLTPMGDNLFYASDASGAAQEVNPEEHDDISILGGALEGSNVNPIKELVNLIQGQRAYEINSNVIRTADEALQIANNLRG